MIHYCHNQQFQKGRKRSLPGLHGAVSASPYVILDRPSFRFSLFSFLLFLLLSVLPPLPFHGSLHTGTQ